MGGLNSTIKTLVNSALRPLDVRIERAHDFSDTANFIPFAATRSAAQSAGLSIGDYVDTVMNGIPDGSRNTVNKLREWGALSPQTRRILEIGPGTGRYLEKCIGDLSPANYEIYETARPWADYLVTTYGVTLRETDGYSLRATPDASVDLVHAHKVFNTIPLMATLCYWHEAVRVLRPGGWIVFDIVTEECLAPDIIERWVEAKIRNGTYPSACPRKVAVDYFSAHRLHLAGEYLFEMPPGKSQLLAFRHIPEPVA